MLTAWMRKILFLGLFAVALSCSSKEEEPQEPVTEEGTDEAAEAPVEGSEAADAEAAEGNAATEETVAEEAPAVDAASTETAESAPAQEASVSPEASATAAPVAEAAPAPVAEAAVADGSQLVMYVKRSGTSVYSQPNGSATFQLEKGDHVLITVEGQWARTPSGQFIKLSQLSQKSVGRDRTGGSWK